MSPTKSLYEFPLSPCSLSNFSSFFGFNHIQFKILHAHMRENVIKMKRVMAVVVAICV